MSDDKPFQCTAPGCGQVSLCYLKMYFVPTGHSTPDSALSFKYFFCKDPVTSQCSLIYLGPGVCVSRSPRVHLVNRNQSLRDISLNMY